MDPRATPEARADTIADVIGHRLCFSGNQDDYYNPDNSYLDSLLKTHQGIPISLSALYLLVARRLGVPLAGITLPGHFIVGLFVRDRKARYYDPFNRGDVIGKVDCVRLVQQCGYRFEERFLLPVNDAQILVRMLNNLRHCYLRRQDTRREQAILRFLAAIDG